MQHIAFSSSSSSSFIWSFSLLALFTSVNVTYRFGARTGRILLTYRFQLAFFLFLADFFFPPPDRERSRSSSKAFSILFFLWRVTIHSAPTVISAAPLSRGVISFFLCLLISEGDTLLFWSLFASPSLPSSSTAPHPPLTVSNRRLIYTARVHSTPPIGSG